MQFTLDSITYNEIETFTGAEKHGLGHCLYCIGLDFLLDSFWAQVSFIPSISVPCSSMLKWLFHQIIDSVANNTTKKISLRGTEFLFHDF